MHQSKTKLMLTKRFFLFLLHPLQLKREFPARLRFGGHIPHFQCMSEWEGDPAQGLAAAGKGQMESGPKAIGHLVMWPQSPGQAVPGSFPCLAGSSPSLCSAPGQQCTAQPQLPSLTSWTLRKRSRSSSKLPIKW